MQRCVEGVPRATGARVVEAGGAGSDGEFDVAYVAGHDLPTAGSPRFCIAARFPLEWIMGGM
jgi:hypothetical protein